MPRSRIAVSVLAAGVTLLPILNPHFAIGAGFDRGLPSIRQDAVLTGIYSASRHLLRRGITPVNVFDLDATLYDAGARHKAIMAEFARKYRERYPDMAARVERWQSDKLPYDVKETFPELGIRSPEEIDRAKDFWSKRFFSNSYLRHDVPIAGGVDFVSQLHDLGSVIVYLTGRHDATMRAGSEEVLRASGFPLDGKRAVLIMAPRKGMKDSVFKGSAEVHEQICRLGQVVGIFDNEPGNCNELQKSFPKALTVFLDTNHSPTAPPVDTGIPWIDNFRWSWRETVETAARVARRERVAMPVR